MPEKPGYFKAMRGRTFKVPRDYCICRSDDHLRLQKKKRSVVVVFEDRSSGLDNLNRKTRRGAVIGAFVGGCPCDDWRKRKKRKRRGRKLKYSNAFSRYRERNPNFEKLGKIKAGTKLGTFKIFVGNQVSSSQNLNTTGDYGGPISAERCWDSLNPGPPYTTGGPLALIKSQVPGPSRTSVGTVKGTPSAPGNWWQYTGDFIDNGDWATDLSSNYLPGGIPTITGYDTLAWDKLKPRVSKAGASQFLYELRDLPRMLQTTFKDILTASKLSGIEFRLTPVNIGGFEAGISGNRWPGRKAVPANMPDRIADSFLNHNFGWVPFLNDLSTMFDVWQRSNDYVSELTRDNGRWKRKRAVLDSTRTVTRIHRSYSPGLEPFGFQIQGLCDTRTIDGIPCKGIFDLYEVNETKVWAEGNFTYYRPEFDMNTPGAKSYIGAIQRLMTLYGVRITPALLYRVTPWTWLVDWFSQFGKFIQRADDFIVDGIVSQGLYVMRHTKREVVKQSTIFFQSGDRTFTFSRSIETKCRKVANSPYGFDQPWSGISLRQAAILGAIGITQMGSGFISRGA